MNKYSVILFVVVLFTLRSVSANPTNNIEDKEETESDANQRTDNSDTKFRRILNQLPGVHLGRISGNVSPADIDTLRQVIQESPNIEWKQFTPAPIQEPNCFVEVQVIQKMPGKCTKLGGRIPACQANNLVTIDYNSCK